MSMLAQLKELPEHKQEQIKDMYSSVFSFDMRVMLEMHGWTDKQPWYKVEHDAPVCCTIYHSLLLELNNIRQNAENVMAKMGVDSMLNNIQANYARDPVTLVRHMYQCLLAEADMVRHFVANMESKPTMNAFDYTSNVSNIMQLVKSLRSEKQELEAQLCQLSQSQEALSSLYQDQSKSNLLVATSAGDNIKAIKHENDQLNSQIQVALNELSIQQSKLIEAVKTASVQLKELQGYIEIELTNWRRGQQLAGNGVAYTGTELDQIQEWCELFLEQIWQYRAFMIKLRALSQSSLINLNVDTLYQLIDLMTGMIYRLVRCTFVIEKQPPQVLKTNTRFTTTARLLVGAKLNLFLSPPMVTVHIISEHQAALISNDTGNYYLGQNESAAGEMMNNNAVMEYQANTRQLCVHFRNMQLRKIKRTEKKGTESVCDEKFSLLFSTRINISSDDLAEIQARVFSLPVVVIVHGNQEPPAHATITWDNAFAALGRQSFVVPDRVPFRQVGEVLSQKFISCVGRGLTEENLKFLAAKALRVSNVNDLDTLITWSQFSKESLPDRNFSFWEWFYAILKVTKEHLRSLWNDELIYGFVWRKQAEEMLSKCAAGTFLLRFSDSELGGLTVAWKGRTADGTADDYPMLQPFTSRDFNIRGLADRLNDLKYLTCLYPDKPKDKVLSKYYTPLNENQKTNSGYVKPLLVTCVPGFPVVSYDSSYPNTPQSGVHQHSPSESPSIHYESSNSQMETSVNDRHGGEESYNMMHPSMMPNLLSDGSMDPINFSLMNNPTNYSYN